MTPFALQVPPRIDFGPGTAAGLPAAAASLGPRALVVTGSSPQRIAGLLDALEPHDLVRVAAEPTLADARAAAAVGRRSAAEVIIGIGGGSVLDLAKAAAVLVAEGGDPLDYIEVIGQGRRIRSSLPVIAVPTTAGTGAEATANAVLASPEHGMKASMRSPVMVPRHAIVDPELTLGCPAEVTAASGMDALTQCLEPYVSNRANPITDGWARTGLIAAGRGLRSAFADGSDLTARTDMSLASLLGGLALANAKLGAVHGFAGVLGGMADAPHGAVCAALLAPVVRANLARADDRLRARLDDIGRWLTGDPTAVAQDGLRWIEDTVGLLGIPGLAAFGLTAGHAEEAVAKAARSSSMQGNPVLLGTAELTDVYLSAL